MSDEVFYYANNEFMSRKGIGYGSLTVHPGGLPHGPHPGRVEESLGKKRTDELAVMLDTFRPLHGRPATRWRSKTPTMPEAGCGRTGISVPPNERASLKLSAGAKPVT